MYLNLLTASTAASGAATQQVSGWSQILSLLIPLAILGVAMYFLIFRPQKKKEKEAAQMRDSLQIGDQITTIGGICGFVVNIKDDSIVIETGSDRSKMRLKKWAIQSVDTVHEDE